MFASAMVIALGAVAPTWARGLTERVSLGQDGAQGNGDSTSSAISAVGRFVAFESSATNLVPGDTNEQRDVFVRDRQTGRTERVSVGPGGVEAAGFSEFPAISADGRFVAFQSKASNLVSGDTNGVLDVFVRDRQTRTTRRVSLGPGGRQGHSHSFGAAISANGRFVAFSSAATNLVAGDTNARVDVFVRDRQNGATQRVGLGPDGVQGNGGSFTGTISADGRFVAFVSDATNLVRGDTNRERNVFVHDRKMGATRRVSLGPGGRQSDGPSGIYDLSLSADGRFVAFDSLATNLVPGDTNDAADIFVRDRKLGTTRRASLGPGNISGNGPSQDPAISADGRFVSFFSYATNLVPGDTNGVRDVFVRTLPP
ncbi:MAG: hypothetical protein WAS21_16270 [Geminicoccaceae bacterium]